MNQDEIDKINQDFDLFFMYEEFDKDKALNFLLKGADPNNGILFITVENTEVEKVKFLLEHGANPNKEFEGHFITESIYDHLEAVYGQMFGYREINSESRKEIEDIINLLLKYGMDINKKSKKYNKTLLDDFIEFKKEYSFGELIEKFLRSVGAKTSEELEDENK